jgi:Flp pilus assembly protein TadG
MWHKYFLNDAERRRWSSAADRGAAVRGACRIRAGIAATEFAITIPILLLLALASADFGRVIHYDEVVSNAARTGAESGATHKFTDFTQAAWQNDVRQAVFDEMENIPNFDQGKLSYNLATTLDADGLATIVVDVSYPFQTVVAWPALPSQVLLHQRFETRQFR